MTTTTDTPHTGLIEGYRIESDRSGVGAAWRTAEADDVDAIDQIAEEIIDGGRASCADYVARNGQHYRWGRRGA